MIQPRAPQNKVDFYRRYHAGEFGNRPRAWADFKALQASHWQGSLISARQFNTRQGRVWLAELLDVIRQENGGTLDGITFVEPVPHHKNLLQGEVSFGPIGELCLTYSTTKNVPQRDCRGPAGRHATGLTALMLLREYLLPRDFDDLMLLAERFPEAAIEFTAFDCFVGVVPHSNTLIWEVRAY